jgi:hypothetical protein
MRVNTKILSFTENKILPEDIAEFQRAAAYQRAVATFTRYNKNEKEVEESDFLAMRNYIITNILIDNAQRAGTPLSMRLRHVQSTEQIGPDHVLTVSN